MSSYWKATIDPLKILEEHAAAINQVNNSLSEIAKAVNANAAAFENLTRQYQYQLNETHKLKKEINELKKKIQ